MQHWMSVETALLRPSGRIGSEWINATYAAQKRWALFTDKARAAVLNALLPDGVATGRLIDLQGLIKVEDHVADAIEKGAEVVTGGRHSGAGLLFYGPTILTGVTSAMTVAREETFGPVAPLFPFDTVDEVIVQANNTEFGLAAYFYARDLLRVWQVAEALGVQVIDTAGNVYLKNEGLHGKPLLTMAVVI